MSTLIRFINDKEAGNLIANGPTVNKYIHFDTDVVYTCHDVVFRINAYTKSVTPMRYLDKSFGKGTNIVGFLSIEKMVSKQVDDYHGERLNNTDVIVGGKNCILVVDDDVTNKVLSKEHSYVVDQSCKLLEHIEVPDVLTKMYLGYLMTDGCENPFEVNFITPTIVDLKCKLLVCRGELSLRPSFSKDIVKWMNGEVKTTDSIVYIDETVSRLNRSMSRNIHKNIGKASDNKLGICAGKKVNMNKLIGIGKSAKMENKNKSRVVLLPVKK